MERFDQRTIRIIKRLQDAKLSLLNQQPFYAILLMRMKFAVDLTCETAYTDGIRIAFNLDFIEDLSDEELEFVLMHEVLHAALGHPLRKQSDYDLECYDMACDIVVNSNILFSFGMDIKKITLKKTGPAIHLTPSGQEGYLFTVEEVYRQLMQSKRTPSNGKGKDGKKDNPSKDRKSGATGGSGDNKGRSKKKEKSSPNSKKSDDTDKDDVSEEALAELIASLMKGRGECRELEIMEEEEQSGEVDDHSFWKGGDENHAEQDQWEQALLAAAELEKSFAGGSKNRGMIPLAISRMVEELKKETLDWRTILDCFVQEEINDYSFAPPDRRMEDCPFFLPDFNEKDENVKNILFMIDTSASMSGTQITECYSEIYGAIRQFNGRLEGKLGFFDAVVVEPTPFQDEEEFKIIRPIGGGGTSFEVIFDYVEKKMADEPPVSIVILTDGFAPYPQEERACGIPVLWIINNEEATPPWGKIARIKSVDAP